MACVGPPVCRYKLFAKLQLRYCRRPETQAMKSSSVCRRRVPSSQHIRCSDHYRTARGSKGEGRLPKLTCVVRRLCENRTDARTTRGGTRAEGVREFLRDGWAASMPAEYQPEVTLERSLLQRRRRARRRNGSAIKLVGRG